MSIQIESRDGVAHFEGEMTIYSAAAMLREALAAINSTAGSASPVVFNLTRVTELDTAGVQVLLAARNLATQQSRNFGIAAASATAREVLNLCGLHELFSSNNRQVA